MLFRHLSQILAVVGVASAAPKPQQLNFDDIVLLNNDGSSTIVKEHEYNALVARSKIAGPAPRYESSSSAVASPKKHRRCDESDEIQVTSDTTFLNWDLAISPVVSAQGGDATVAVANGYSLSNSVSVSEGVTATLIEKVLTATLSLTYTETWTTTETQTFSYKVPDGQFGLVVSQPQVRRVEGNYLSGCIDTPDKKAFTSDTYTSQSYSNLEWVKGVIRLCNSTTYPVPFCIGEGTHS